MAAMVITVVLAICTGLAGLAMTKPLIFARMYTPLKHLMAAAYFAVAVYLMSVNYAFTTLLPVITFDKIRDASALIDGIGVSMPVFMLSSVLAWAFVTFLGWVAQHNIDDQEKVVKEPPVGK